MFNHRPRISLRSLLGLAALLLVGACSLDESVVITTAGTGGRGSVTATGAGTAGSVGLGGATAATVGTGGSTSSAGSGGATTTAGAGGNGGEATTVGAGGSGGAPTTVGAGGTAGAGGNMGGSAGAGGDMGGSAGNGGAAGGGPGPVLHPTGIAVVGMNPTNEPHPGMGDPHADPCTAPDEVLIGFDGSMDTGADAGPITACDLVGNCWLKSATGHCGKLALVGSGPFTVTITAAEDLPLRGSTGNLPLTPARCAQDQMIVGFTGRAGNYIDQVSFYCAPVTVVGDSTNGYTVVVGSSTLVGPLGGNGGNGFGDNLCAQGEAASGTNLHSGAWFDGFGLNCGLVTLTGMLR